LRTDRLTVPTKGLPGDSLAKSNSGSLFGKARDERGASLDQALSPDRRVITKGGYVEGSLLADCGH
jgi:hypothetical protein